MSRTIELCPEKYSTFPISLLLSICIYTSCPGVCLNNSTTVYIRKINCGKASSVVAPGTVVADIDAFDAAVVVAVEISSSS
jgi:hypothetical protein